MDNNYTRAINNSSGNLPRSSLLYNIIVGMLTSYMWHEMVGQGGFGSVYKLTQMKDGHTIVIIYCYTYIIL